MPATTRTSLAVSAVVIGLAAAASPAAAQTGHALSLTGPATAVTGQPSVLRATGSVPADVFLQRYVNVYAIPTSVVSACPSAFVNAMQLSYASSAQGGDTVAVVVPAPTGEFSLPIAYTPSVPGQFLLCAYLHEGVETMAASTLVVAVGAPGGTTPPPTAPGETAVRPRNVGKPKVVRAKGKLTCRRGAWTGAPTRYAYRWRVAGKKRGSRQTLRVTRAVRGRKVACAVTASNAAGSTTAVSRAVRTR